MTAFHQAAPQARLWAGFVSVLLACVLLAGCNGLDAEIEREYQRGQQQLDSLRQALERGQLSNANLLREYARLVTERQPRLEQLMTQLASDAGTEGPLYQGLTRRLQQSTQPGAFEDDQAHLDELSAITAAASLEVFNDALSDPVNVIADLSGGQLSRINAISKQASLAANNAQDQGPGSQLIGNPNYGQWQTDADGLSFWEWYGVYALLSNVLDFDRPRRVRYDHWVRSRDYSYYNDYGRYHYSSPRQRSQSQQVFTRNAKKFSSDQRFASAYAKPRTGSSSVSARSQSNQVRQQAFTQQRFTSSYGKSPGSSTKTTSTPKSKTLSSFRNSSSKTSRGISRGK